MKAFSNEIKAVVFDMDGVIFDTERMFLDAWRTIGEKYQIDDVENSAIKCIGLSQEDSMNLLLNRYGKDFPLEKYRSEIWEMVEHKMKTEGMPIKTGVREILDFLSKASIPLGLASSTDIERVVSSLENANLKHYFDVIIGGNMIEHSKPDPQIYLLACKKLNVQPKNTVAIEDSKNGIISAYRAGINPIVVPDILQPDEEILKMACKKFDNLLEVKSFLHKKISTF